MARRSYRRGETLFHAGDPGDSLHLIDKGRVAIRASSRAGDEAILVVLGRGDSFGEQALLNPTATRTASAVALESVETRVLLRTDFTELRREQPSVERFLVEVLAAQVRRLSDQLMEALYLPVESAGRPPARRPGLGLRVRGVDRRRSPAARGARLTCRHDPIHHQPGSAAARGRQRRRAGPGPHRHSRRQDIGRSGPLTFTVAVCPPARGGRAGGNGDHGRTGAQSSGVVLGRSVPLAAPRCQHDRARRDAPTADRGRG